MRNDYAGYRLSLIAEAAAIILRLPLVLMLAIITSPLIWLRAETIILTARILIAIGEWMDAITKATARCALRLLERVGKERAK